MRIPPPTISRWHRLLDAAATVALYGASGFLRRRVRWRRRLTGRSLVAYVAAHAASAAVLAEAMVRWAAMGERMRETRAALAAELGREPTEEELHEALMERYAD